MYVASCWRVCSCRSLVVGRVQYSVAQQSERQSLMEEEETGEESLNYTEDSSVVMLDFTHQQLCWISRRSHP